MFLPGLLHSPCALLTVTLHRRWSNKVSTLVVSMLLAIFWRQKIGWS